MQRDAWIISGYSFFSIIAGLPQGTFRLKSVIQGCKKQKKDVELLESCSYIREHIKLQQVEERQLKKDS